MPKRAPIHGSAWPGCADVVRCVDYTPVADDPWHADCDALEWDRVGVGVGVDGGDEGVGREWVSDEVHDVCAELCAVWV